MPHRLGRFWRPRKFARARSAFLESEVRYLVKRSVHGSKALGERFRSPYRAFSAELIQHQFRQITFPQLLDHPARPFSNQGFGGLFQTYHWYM